MSVQLYVFPNFNSYGMSLFIFKRDGSNNTPTVTKYILDSKISYSYDNFSNNTLFGNQDHFFILVSKKLSDKFESQCHPNTIQYIEGYIFMINEKIDGCNTYYLKSNICNCCLIS